MAEGSGVPVGLAHEGANPHDKKLLEPTLGSIPIERPKPTTELPQGICLDRGGAGVSQGGRARGSGQGRQETDLGQTALWTRVNALDSPWVLDDLTTLLGEIGDQLDVVMVPKVEGPWDIHYVDRLLAQLSRETTSRSPS